MAHGRLDAWRILIRELIDAVRHWNDEVGSLVLGFGPVTQKEGNAIMNGTLSLDQTGALSVKAKHRGTSAAAITIQNPVWSSSDETILQVGSPTDDGAGTYGATVDTISEGSARVVLSGDADLGDGVKPVSAVYNIDVTAGTAVILEAAPIVASDKP